MSKRAKRRFIVLIVAICATGTGVMVFKTARSIQRDRLLSERRAEGMGAYKQDDLEACLNALSYFIQHNKEDVEVLMTFADARSRVPMVNNEHLIESAAYYQRIVGLLDQEPPSQQRDDKLARSLHALLDLRDRMGHQVELLDAADRVLALEPDDVDALSAKARVLFHNRDFESALPVVERLATLELDAIHWRHVQLEIAESTGQRIEDLIAQIDDWIDEYQGDGRLYVLKAAWLVHAGRTGEALTALDGALNRGLESREGLTQCVALADGLNVRPLGDKAIAQARNSFQQESWVYEVATQRYWLGHDIPRAIEELDAADAVFDQLTPELQRIQILVFAAQDRHEEAFAALDTLAQLSEGTTGEQNAAWAGAMRARLQVEDIGWHDAIERFRAAESVLPNDAVIQSLLAEAYEAMGDDGRALHAWRRAQDLQPQWIAAVLSYCDMLIRVGRPLEAFERSIGLVRYNRTRRVAAFLTVGRAWLAACAAGELDPFAPENADFIRMLETLNLQFADRPEVVALLIDGYMLLDQEERARSYMQGAIESGDRPADVYLTLLRVSRRYELGFELSLLEAAARQDPASFHLAIERARVFAERGQITEALGVVNAARAESGTPSSVDVMREYVTFLADINHESALDELHALLQVHGTEPSVVRFVLSQQIIWNDEQLVSDVIQALAAIAGEDSPQVFLARARRDLRFKADNEAALAEAFVLINSVLERTPDSFAGLVLMAEACLAGKEPAVDRAAAYLAQAIEMYPGQIGLYPRLVALYQEAGDFAAAGRVLRQLELVTARDSVTAQWELELLQIQGDFESALSRAQRMIDATSDPAEQLVLASLLMRNGHMLEADKVYNRLLDVHRSDPTIVQQAAAFYGMTGQFHRGLDLLTSTHTLERESARHLAVGMYHEQFGSADDAMIAYQHVIAVDDQSTEAWSRIAGVHLAQGKPHAAREAALKGLAIDPDDSTLSLTLALAQIDSNGVDAGQAIAALQTTQVENAALLEVLQILQSSVRPDGSMRADTKTLERARKLIANQPSFLPAWRLTMTLLHEVGHLDEAIRIGRRAMSRFPSRAEPAAWVTSLLVTQGQWEEALIEAQEWRRRSAHRPLAVDVQIAAIQSELRRNSAALATLMSHEDTLVSQRVSQPENFALWIRTLIVNDRQDRARQLMQPVLRESEQWLSFWIALARIADRATAEAIVQDADALVGNSPSLQLQLAAEYNSLGRRSDNKSHLERATALARRAAASPEHQASSSFMLGVIAESQDDLQTAATHYRDVLRIDSEDVAALNNLAFVLAQLSTNIDEALRIVTKARKLAPDSPDVLDTYGFVLLKHGRASEAMTLLSTAVEARPGDASIRMHLVEALLEADQHDRASHLYDEIQRDLAAGTATLYPDQRRQLARLGRRLEPASTAAIEN